MTMTFRKWLVEADIPMQAADEGWYDAETGIPFARSAAKPAKAQKSEAEIRHGKRTAKELKEMVDRLIASQKIDVERNADKDVSASVAVIAQYEATEKMTKAIALQIIEANSKASRILNAQK